MTGDARRGRGRGRPRVGAKVSFHCDDETLAAVEAARAALGLTRAEALRRALALGAPMLATYGPLGDLDETADDGAAVAILGDLDLSTGERVGELLPDPVAEAHACKRARTLNGGAWACSCGRVSLDNGKTWAGGGPGISSEDESARPREDL